MPGEGELNEPETSNGALFRSRSGRRRDLCSAEGHGVASLDSPGAAHLAVHPDVDFVVACRCAQDPAVLGEISLRKCGHDAAGQWSVISSTTSSPIRSSRPTQLLSTNWASSFSGRTTMLGRKRLTSKRPCG